jgi:hypothetical protein
MPADLTKVTARVLWIIGAQSASFNDVVSDDRFVQEEVKRAVVEAEEEVARIICEISHPQRVTFLTSSSVAHSSVIPQHIGPIERVVITRWTGDSGVDGEKTSRDNILRWRQNLNNIFGTLAHNATNSPLAGYYNITDDVLYFTGQSAVVHYCNYTPNFTSLQIDASFEHMLVPGAVVRLNKIGVPQELISSYGALYSQALQLLKTNQETIPELPMVQAVS